MTRVLFRGGYVHSRHDPHATAIAVDAGQVVWTGDDDAADSAFGAADRVVELGGRLVTPAFVDAHVHLAETGLAAMGVDLSGASSLADALELLSVRARAGGLSVVLAHGWDESTWPEGRPPTRAELDRAVDGRPAYLARVDEHSALASTALLDTAAARDLPVTRLDGWQPDGPLSRDAHHALRDAVRRLLSGADLTAAIEYALRQAARMGIGMVHELGAPHLSDPEDFDRIADLSAQDVLPRVVGYWGEPGPPDLVRRLGLAGAAGDLCADGAIGSRSAALRSPYTDDPGNTGRAYLDAEQVRDHVVACTELDLQAGFHCIGDRAVGTVLDGFRAAARVVGTAALLRARHRLEHVEMVGPDEAATLAELGVVASMQPAFDHAWGGDGGLYAQRLGADRAERLNPFAMLSRAGISLAFGSDSPVTAFDPWLGVRAAAWHHNPDQRLTVRAAFNAHTRGGWRAARLDHGGELAPGSPADIAVWDVPGELMVQTPDTRVAAWSTDPRAGVPQLPDLDPALPLPTCVLTMVDGRIAFELAGVLD